MIKGLERARADDDDDVVVAAVAVAVAVAVELAVELVVEMVTGVNSRTSRSAWIRTIVDSGPLVRSQRAKGHVTNS
jgi:hypothetical protein